MGAAVPAARAEALRKSPSELLRFLADEAAARAEGRELLPPAPLHRPLRDARVLVVGEQDAPAVGRLWGHIRDGMCPPPLVQEGVRFDAVRVGPFNPAMGKLGGMGEAERERLSILLEFRDGSPLPAMGSPQADVVVISPVYEHELAMPGRPRPLPRQGGQGPLRPHVRRVAPPRRREAGVPRRGLFVVPPSGGLPSSIPLPPFPCHSFSPSR